MVDNTHCENMGIIPYAENLLSSYSNNDSNFLPNYLSKNIGKWVKVEHLIGNSLVSHIGQLIASGIDYIVLKLEGGTLATIVCNIKDIRFITIIYSKNTNLLK